MGKRITLLLTWKVMLTSVITIFVICVLLSFAGYKIYKKILVTEENQRLFLLSQKERSEELLGLQEKALNQAQEELNKTKSEAEKTNAQIKTLTQTLKDQSSVPKEIIISSSDLSPYMSGVIQVICSSPTGISSGSGSLWTFKEVTKAIITNYHVVKDATKCVIAMTNSSNVNTGLFSISGAIYTYNQNSDGAILAIGSSVSSNSVPIENYNYTLSQMRKCSSLVPVGSPVVIIGYPAYAKRDSIISIDTIGTVNTIYRTVTNGIISGYDTSRNGEPNYFVSAKIDNGNSGGMALAKDTNGLCVLGLPTWLTVGNYENQGLVQNILNILPKN